MALAAFLFLVVSVTYSVLVPMYEAPDEGMHVRYVEKLAYDHELPEPAETHQTQHPPLYYALGAVVLAVFDLPEPPDLPISPTFPATTAVHVHHGEGFPYHNGVLSLHLLRAISILFGLGIVVLTYLLAEALFPGRRMLAFSSAATAGLVPQFAFIGAMVSNDIPAAFFATGVIYCGVKLLKSGEPRWLLASSLLLGLGMLTKASVAVSGIVPFVAVTVSARGWQVKVRDVALLALVPLALAGWYYVRSIILWGDVFTTVDKVEGLPFRIGDARGLGDPIYRNDFLGAVVDSYWYKGGYLNVEFTPLVYSVLNLFPVAAAAGLIVAFRRCDVPARTGLACGLLALLPLAAFLGTIQYSVMHDYAAQGRYLFTAQAAIGILLAFGISTLFSREPGKDHPAMLVLPAILVLMNIWIFAVKLPAAY